MISRIEGRDVIAITLTERRWISIGLNGWKGHRAFWLWPVLHRDKFSCGGVWLWFNADLWYDDERSDGGQP